MERLCFYQQATVAGVWFVPPGPGLCFDRIHPTACMFHNLMIGNIFASKKI
jgi:hypothetical protein